jgi:hypothetical protein
MNKFATCKLTIMLKVFVIKKSASSKGMLDIGEMYSTGGQNIAKQDVIGKFNNR